MQHRALLITALLVSLLVCSSVVSGQTLTGSISGFVHDPSQAVVSGASVVATNAETSFSKEATTSTSGEYRILALPAGKYRVTVTASGFQASTVTDIDLKVNDQLRVDVNLQVGNLQQQVSVEANAVQVNTEVTTLGDVIESQKMNAMPLNGRSYLDLLGLQAGVVPVSAGTMNNDRSVSGMFGRPGNVSVNGQSEGANNFLVNGGDVNESKNMGAGLLPNLDSVAEFRLLTNTFDAEYGRFSGAIMNSVTKSGTNGLHGDVFEFIRNSDLDARGFFDPVRAALHRNQFGYAVGGPFWRNRLFWFTDYQGTRQVQGASTGLLQIPSADEYLGKFPVSALSGSVNGSYWAQQLTSRLGYAVTPGEPYSFSGCTMTSDCVFPSGAIPQAFWDKVAVNYLKGGYFPAANVNPATGLYADASAKGTVRDDKAGQRVDFINQKTGNWSFYYHFDDSTVFTPLSTQGNSSAVSLPGTPISTPARAQMFVLSDTKTISPTTVNELRMSFFRTAVHTAEPSKQDYADTAALGFTTGIGTLGINPTGPAGYPDLLTPLYFNNYTIGPNWLNMFQAVNTYMLTDGFSKVTGSHSLKIGGEARYFQLNVRNICGPYGYFTFTGLETGNDFADFLIGAPSTYVQCSMQFLDDRSRYGGVYIQDSWKAKPNLTLNLGLRWEAAEPWADPWTETEIPGQQSQRFPTAPLGLVVPGDPGVPLSISPTRYRNFAPRLGLAYSPGANSGPLAKLFGGPGKTSIRAAFGLFYVAQADTENFGVIGDAPWGLYWASTAPPMLDTPFQTRSNGASQGVHFPFTFPSRTGSNADWNFTQYFPLWEPAYSPYNKMQYTAQYNFSIQREVSKATVLTLAYVGNQGHHLPVGFNLTQSDGNLCMQLQSLGCGPYAEGSVFTLPSGKTYYSTILPTTTPGISNQQAGTVAWLNAQWNWTIGNSHYNAGQITLEHKTSDLTFTLAYTFSKSLDNTADFNPFNFSLNRSLSPWDMTHNFVASYVWNLPFNRWLSSAPKRLTDGWTFTGVTHFTTGFPITLSQSGDMSLTFNGADVPNVVGQVVKQNPRNAYNGVPNMYFQPGAFASEELGQLGDANPRYFHGPGLNSFDFGLGKTTKITESMSFLIRAEFFNVFNHAQFQNPVGNFSSSQFGEVTSAYPGRIGQLGAKFIW